MTVKVKFFARLREELDTGQAETEASDAPTVRHVWAAVTGRPLPDDIFCAVNFEHAGFDHPVNDGDEVAFFPRITGG